VVPFSKKNRELNKARVKIRNAWKRASVARTLPLVDRDAIPTTPSYPLVHSLLVPMLQRHLGHGQWPPRGPGAGHPQRPSPPKRGAAQPAAFERSTWPPALPSAARGCPLPVVRPLPSFPLCHVAVIAGPPPTNAAGDAASGELHTPTSLYSPKQQRDVVL
jgi:hypothetical protein